jgi:hypothetical protein
VLDDRMRTRNPELHSPYATSFFLRDVSVIILSTDLIIKRRGFPQAAFSPRRSHARERSGDVEMPICSLQKYCHFAVLHLAVSSHWAPPILCVAARREMPAHSLSFGRDSCHYWTLSSRKVFVWSGLINIPDSHTFFPTKSVTEIVPRGI